MRKTTSEIIAGDRVRWPSELRIGAQNKPPPTSTTSGTLQPESLTQNSQDQPQTSMSWNGLCRGEAEHGAYSPNAT